MATLFPIRLFLEERSIAPRQGICVSNIRQADHVRAGEPRRDLGSVV